MTVGRLFHDFGHELIERLDARLGLTATEQSSMMDIPGRQVGQRPTAFIFMLHTRGFARLRCLRGM